VGIPINNLKELLLTTAKKYGDRPAFDFARKKEVVSVGYHTFKSDACALGTYFFDMNIKNTRIALLGENSYEWILSWFAAVCGGNVAVPIDNELPASEIINLFDDSGAEVFAYSDAYSEIAAFLLENGFKVKHFISMGDLPSFVEMGGALIRDGDTRWFRSIIEGKTPAALLYESETDAAAKSRLLSHQELVDSAVATSQNAEEKYKSTIALPFHKPSTLTNLLGMLLNGNEIIINRSVR